MRLPSSTTLSCLHLADKGQHSQNYGFSSSDVWKWKLDHQEGWPPKNWCFWIVVLEDTLESLLDCEEIKLIGSKGNQPWVLTGRPDPEAEALILWPSYEKRRLPGKDPVVGKVWRREEKGTTEDEMVGQCHRSDQHEFDATPGGSGRQGGPGVLWSMKSWTRLNN